MSVSVIRKCVMLLVLVSALVSATTPAAAASKAQAPAHTLQAKQAIAAALNSSVWRTTKATLARDGFRILSPVVATPDPSHPEWYVVGVAASQRAGSAKIAYLAVNIQTRHVIGQSLETIQPKLANGNYRVLFTTPGLREQETLNSHGKVLSRTSQRVNSKNRTPPAKPFITENQECGIGVGFVGVYYCGIWAFVGIWPGIICAAVWVPISVFACS